ncbi:MAG TPA: hypothetical protein VFX45_09660, partial [Solirubrobacterales bacterium]|nr:hypothetical protein [Solirubrobacterales bacterium]
MPACRHAEAREEKKTKSTKPKPKAKVKKEAKKQSQGRQKKSQKASQEPRRRHPKSKKGRPQKQQPNSPTHYALGSRAPAQRRPMSFLASSARRADSTFDVADRADRRVLSPVAFEDRWR